MVHMNLTGDMLTVPKHGRFYIESMRFDHFDTSSLTLTV